MVETASKAGMHETGGMEFQIQPIARARSRRRQLTDTVQAVALYHREAWLERRLPLPVTRKLGSALYGYFA